MRKMTKLMLALTIPAAMLAGNANAAFISQWDYENQVGFSASLPASVTGSSANNSATFALGTSPANLVFGDPTRLSWGVPATNAGQSSLFLNGFTAPSASDPNTNGQYNGVVDTNGNYVLDSRINHDNNVVYAPTLTSATLFGSLLLKAKVPASPAVQLPTLNGVFEIKF